MCDGLVHLAWYEEHTVRSGRRTKTAGPVRLRLIRISEAGRRHRQDLRGYVCGCRAARQARAGDRHPLQDLQECAAPDPRSLRQETGLPYAWAGSSSCSVRTTSARFVTSIAAAVRRRRLRRVSRRATSRLPSRGRCRRRHRCSLRIRPGPVSVASGVGVTLGAVADELVRLGGKVGWRGPSSGESENRRGLWLTCAGCAMSSVSLEALSLGRSQRGSPKIG